MAKRIWHSAAGQGEFGERKTVVFDGAAGSGEAGTAVPLFRVTGSVIALTIAVCTDTLLVSDGATIEVGTAANPVAIIAQTLATNINVGEIWVDAAPNVLYCWTTAWGCMIGDGADIELMPRTANVTGGTLVFTCFWTPLTDNGNVVVV